MTDDTARKLAWLDDYITALPPRIRPREDDDRFLAAARAAYGNGWTGAQLAAQVSLRNYGNASNPILIAIMHMEQLAGRPPHIRAVVLNASGCGVCAPGVRCDDPVTGADRIPRMWVDERMGLLRELMRTSGLAEDERAECMRVLIGDQRTRV